jgi:hypothetical protein
VPSVNGYFRKREEVREMLEACYCGRTGQVEDREPVLDGEGVEALRCPRCGHLDRLEWLSEMDRNTFLSEAKRRKQTKDAA